jgi:hypothetical protein
MKKEKLLINRESDDVEIKSWEPFIDGTTTPPAGDDD